MTFFLTLVLAAAVVADLTYYCSSTLDVPFPVNATGKEILIAAIIHRHGDRTPVFPLNVDDGISWNCTLDTLATTARVSTSAALPLGRVYRRNFVPDEEALPGDCEFGQLTAKGDAQHARLGAAYRAKYVQVLRLLPARLNQSQIFLRSTSYSRTFASLAANFGGLYPPQTRTDGLIDVSTVNTRDTDRDYLLGGDGRGCPKIATLLKALEMTPTYSAVQAAIDALGVQINSTVGTSDVNALRDQALARMCRGLDQFDGLDETVLEEMDYNLTQRYYMRRSTDDLKKYSIGPFFYQVLRLFDMAARGDPRAPRWAHFSAHDSTMTSVNAVLGRKPIWPPYAAHVEFELWRDSADGALYVQTSADGHTIRPLGAQWDMVPLEWFRDALKPVLISEQRWRDECGSPFATLATQIVH